jgi:hypothetical protein
MSPYLKGDSKSLVQIQKLMPPGGEMIDPVSRQYRTNKIQPLFSYIVDMTRDTEGQKKDSPIKNTDESYLVAGTRLERASVRQLTDG